MDPVTVQFTNYRESVAQIFNLIEADRVLSEQQTILIKPNLVNASPPPVTTPVECCEAVVDYIRKCSSAQIIIAEGCGDAFLETDQVFEQLNYKEMAVRKGVELIDLNHAPLERLTNSSCRHFPEMHLPEIVLRSFIISVPVLKAHSLAELTGTLKNMIGIAPPQYYSGQYGTWKKAVFHDNIHEAITDLNAYCTPDLSLMDARVGLVEYHLGGREASPPVNRLLAGFDPVQVDRKAAGLLGIDWTSIPHLR